MLNRRIGARTLAAVIAVLFVTGCPARKDVQCQDNTSCDLATGGVCLAASTSDMWCAYPDTSCPSGYRYSNDDVGDNLGATCTVPGQTFTLTVSVAGSGSGNVTSTPAGVDCSTGSCMATFASGTQVDLASMPHQGAFLGWSGDCGGFTSCTITMDQDRTVGALFGMPGDGLWVLQLGGASDERAFALATASDNNLIAVGMFGGTIQAGSFTLTSNGSSDIYVIKINSVTGDVIWAKSYGGIDSDSGVSVALDAADNIYLTGSFTGSIDFGSGHVLTGVGATDVLVLKLTATGDYVWAQSIGGTDYDNPGAIAVKNGQVAVIASYRSSMTVDGMSFTSVGLFDVVLASLTTDGAYNWVKSLGGSGIDSAFGIAIDSSGNVVATGRFANTVNFGGGPLTSAGNADVFMAKYAGATGAFLLAKQFGSTGPDSGNAVAVDSSDNMILIAEFSGTVDFGCASPLTSSSTEDIVVAKYSPAGACLWSNRYGTAGDGAVATSVTVNTAGDLAATGNFCGTISFGGPSLSSATACPSNDVFAVRLSGADGSHVNSVRAGGAGDEYGQGVTESSDGRLFVSGRFQGFADFAGHALTSAGGNDAFVLGLAPL